MLPESQRSRITFLASVIYHKDGLADVNVRDRAAIAEVADFVLEKDGRVRVYGHASAATRGLKPEAAKKANFEVSRQRALTVRRELITNKVPSEHVRAFAVSDRRPAVPETSPQAEAINRRTEIFVRF
jgi:flagellar motor protein MotB